jgi:hypothetical protein
MLPYLRVGGGREQLRGVRAVQRFEYDVGAAHRHRGEPGGAPRPQIVGHRRGDPGVGLGDPGHETQRQHPGPVRQPIVGRFVDNAAEARLDRHVLQRQGQHGGLGEFPPGGRPAVGGPPPADLLHQRRHRGPLLRLVGDQAGVAVRDNGPVIGAVVELGAAVDQAVEQRDGHAHRQAGGAAGGQQRPAAGRPVQVERVIDADVQGGQDPWLAGQGECQGAVVGLVEDRVCGGPLVRHPTAAAGRRCPIRHRVHAVSALF